MAKDPTSAGTELCAGTAENEKELETSMQAGVAGSRTEVMLPSNGGRDGATHTEAEEVTNNDASLLARPVLPVYDLNCG